MKERLKYERQGFHPYTQRDSIEEPKQPKSSLFVREKSSTKYVECPLFFRAGRCKASILPRQRTAGPPIYAGTGINSSIAETVTATLVHPSASPSLAGSDFLFHSWQPRCSLDRVLDLWAHRSRSAAFRFAFCPVASHLNCVVAHHEFYVYVVFVCFMF
ncbi:hypothetical protein AVEN_114219-1 [Araneus ventricosus]|uniref:Uncharacterized protein n=1 Tax=Araneus ventricosus TaxID=182803 RepID=A0A4Y2PAE3_ARAVE|nr:hypothetical protein AVEN_161941-1 [Araneus ventricosus]GBN47223.1 hypothetical protein AVEN_114219-1 [Araneus ventricosus]